VLWNIFSFRNLKHYTRRRIWNMKVRFRLVKVVFLIGILLPHFSITKAPFFLGAVFLLVQLLIWLLIRFVLSFFWFDYYFGLIYLNIKCQNLDIFYFLFFFFPFHFPSLFIISLHSTIMNIKIILLNSIWSSLFKFRI